MLHLYIYLGLAALTLHITLTSAPPRPPRPSHRPHLSPSPHGVTLDRRPTRSRRDQARVWPAQTAVAVSLAQSVSLRRARHPPCTPDTSARTLSSLTIPVGQAALHFTSTILLHVTFVRHALARVVTMQGERSCPGRRALGLCR